MSDEVTQAVNVAQDAAVLDATPAQDADETFDKARAMATIAKLREAEKRGRDAEKQLAALKAQQDAADEAKLKTEKRYEELANKWKQEAEAAKQELERERISTLRLKVGMAKGIPPRLAERLIGDTQDEMEADADEILKLMPKNAATEPAVQERPQAPDLNATGVPTAKNPKTTLAKLTLEELAVAKKQGITPEDYAKWKES